MKDLKLHKSNNYLKSSNAFIVSHKKYLTRNTSLENLVNFYKSTTENVTLKCCY